MENATTYPPPLKRHSSSFKFPARNIITPRTWHGPYIHSPKLPSAVDHAGDRYTRIFPPYTVAYKSDMHTRDDTARLIIEKRTTRRARPENCGPSSRLLHTNVCSPKEREWEGNKERALRKSSFRERLSRQVSGSTLRAAPRARERISVAPDFRERLFPHTYAFVYFIYVLYITIFYLNIYI